MAYGVSALRVAICMDLKPFSRPPMYMKPHPSTRSRTLLLLGCALTLSFSACSTPMKMGGNGSVAAGSAGGANGAQASGKLESCSSPVGTASFIEDTSAPWYHTLTGTYGLPSTVMVLRLLAQQSNCFIVVERNQGMRAMETERSLEQSGELRSGSNYGRGQVVSADYSIVPAIIFSSTDSGGIGGAVAGVSRYLGPVRGLADLAGNVQRREASTVLALNDNRSSVQVAVAEGSASTMDIGGSAWGWGLPGSLWSNMDMYSRTPQGKVLVAAFTDSFNQMVRAVRNYRPQQILGQRSGTGGKLKVH